MDCYRIIWYEFFDVIEDIRKFLHNTFHINAKVTWSKDEIIGSFVPITWLYRLSQKDDTAKTSCFLKRLLAPTVLTVRSLLTRWRRRCNLHNLFCHHRGDKRRRQRVKRLRSAFRKFQTESLPSSRGGGRGFRPVRVWTNRVNKLSRRASRSLFLLLSFISRVWRTRRVLFYLPRRPCGRARVPRVVSKLGAPTSVIVKKKKYHVTRP